ncbi:MAG: bifunctional phosphopantothenoylcysteine decarboxylase/phosphopantothenate--cysteine ligase CoaBC [Candidatus Hadarchaeota archaeon]
MHPSHDIRGTKGRELEGRRIVLCLTGSVAISRSPELARELMRRGADVRVVMSDDAAELVTPKLMHWATGNDVVTELTGKIEHVSIGQWADLVLVAPATANTIGKISWAVDDTPVTSAVSVAMGLGKPVAIVPAMHGSMYDHKLLKENLDRLLSAGVQILEPRVEEAKAKFPDVEEVVNFVVNLLGPKDMEGVKVLITAGPTIEPIDPIKIITNRSTGKMGLALARVASMRGADVTLVYGPGGETPPSGVRTIRVERTQEMKEAFDKELLKKPDIVACAAAPQDFVVEEPSKAKLRHTREITLRLKPAPRIIDGARRRAPKAIVIGFKAEHGVTDKQLVAVARAKLSEHRIDMVVANDVSREGAGFGTDTNEVALLTPSETKHMRATKQEIAGAIFDAAMKKLKAK